MCCLFCSVIAFNCPQSVFVSALVHLGRNCIHDGLLSEILTGVDVPCWNISWFLVSVL